jgi:hypothetical protein
MSHYISFTVLIIISIILVIRITIGVVSQLRRLVVGFPLRRLGFYHRPVHVGFVVNKVTVEQVPPANCHSTSFSIFFNHPIIDAMYPLGADDRFTGVKRQNREADHSPPSSFEVTDGGGIPPLSYRVVLN